MTLALEMRLVHPDQTLLRSLAWIGGDCVLGAVVAAAVTG